MDMDKVVRVGTGEYGGVFCRVTITNGKLSITGVEGPKKNGDAAGGCGQITDCVALVRDFAPGWSAASVERFVEIWRAWHLNDMRPGCVHQRAWDTRREITVTCLTWGEAYHALRTAASDGRLSADGYADYSACVPLVERLTLGLNCPLHRDVWGADGEVALARDLVRVEKVETKAAGWVDHRTHPEGLLSKPCPTCGYTYGSAWLREELPAAVVAFLAELPETDLQPAWV